MDVSLSSVGTLEGSSSSYGGFDLQGTMSVPHHHVRPRQGSSIAFTRISENRPAIGDSAERGKSTSDDEDPSFTEEYRNDHNQSKKASQWHRVKWSDSMVRLLITAVSYISEEVAAEYVGAQRRKILTLHKKGKWKSVSKVMAERGHFVSPQQCEDKFNDLNKRYKRLNEILGRGTSCEVVENPSLLDMMDHISNKEKEEVRKILSSKHLYYEEMCSYHNGNRLHLPPDPELQHSLRLALMSRDDPDDNDAKSHENEEADHDSELEDFVGSEQNKVSDHRTCGLTKRAKQTQSSEDFSFKNSFISIDCNRGISPNQMASETTRTMPEQRISLRNLQLEEQRLHIQEQMLELEKERFKWQQFCQKQDGELEIMRLENQMMKMENEQMALELKRKEIGIDNK